MANDGAAGGGFAVGERELREDRRRRLFDALDRAGLDALVLGRRDAIAYATGVRSLWTAGTRAAAPACVLVAEGRAVHLLSTWDEGVPDEIPFDHLYGVTWNPTILAEAVAGIAGLGRARRVGVDGLSVGLAGLLARAAPEAELVPADDLLTAVRAVKAPGEVERIRAATAVAAAGVAAAARVLEGGGDPAAARGAALRALAARGVTVPVAPPAVGDLGGGLATVDVGVLADGYEGTLARTVARPSTSGAAARVAAARAAQERLIRACRPGATGRDLRAAAAEAGLPAETGRGDGVTSRSGGLGGSGSPAWLVRGSGMGVELPVVSAETGADAELVAGMVLAVEARVDGAVRRDAVLVGPDGPAPLG
ncbi:MAG TPA: M24 family metallopeptidase [Acidimicrobiales bacterium]